MRRVSTIPVLLLLTWSTEVCSLSLFSSLKVTKGTLLFGPRGQVIRSFPIRPPCDSGLDRICWNSLHPRCSFRRTFAIGDTEAHVRRRRQYACNFWRKLVVTTAASRAAKVIGAIGMLLLALITKSAPALASSAADGNVARSIVSRQVQVSVESAFRIVFASLLGSVLGFERSSTTRKGGQSTGAGMRTMALVSLGACVFCMCGTHGFAVHCATESIPGLEYAAVDTSRMASSIATGVGFIGAGVITNNRSPDGTYDRESAVRGLTTAATIWMSAAVGAAAGAGMYFAAGQFVLLCLVVLRFGEWWVVQTKDSLRRTDNIPPKMKLGPRDGSNEGISEVKNVPSVLASEASGVVAEPESKMKSSTETIDENVVAVEEVEETPTSTDQVSVELTNATQAGALPVESSKDTESKSVDTLEKSKSVDPLVERWIKRGGIVGEGNSTNTDQNGDDPDDNADSQQIIW